MIFITASFLFAEVDVTSISDIYNLALNLKAKVKLLRKISNIKSPFPTAPTQRNKLPRHVIQKSIEVLSKINQYRKIKKMGEITIPFFPSRDITNQDLYMQLRRLNDEVKLLLGNRKAPEENDVYIIDVSSNDIYELLWSISLAFDPLINIRGFTPTDLYAQSIQIVNIVSFIRKSQNIHTTIKPFKVKPNLHPNHALYEASRLLKKISKAQKKLWIKPVEVPKIPQRIITSTEVYDYLQGIIAELERIKERLGIERYFEVEEVKEKKTSSDVVKNLRYAFYLMPTFDFDKKIIQYDKSSLKKTPNDVYAVSEFIIKKLELYKEFKGIKVRPKVPPKLYGLKPIHVYQKAIENIQKIQKVRIQEGMFESATPIVPVKEISNSEVYELLLKMDKELNIILKKNGIKNVKSWSVLLEKPTYDNKEFSDVYFNLWKLSYIFDTILGEEYTANELYRLSMQVEGEIDIILKHIGISNKINKREFAGKREKDIFKKSLNLFDLIKKIQKRANMSMVDIIIPKERIITPSSIYNALRVITAALMELKIHYGIEKFATPVEIGEKKTLSDVFGVLDSSYRKLQMLLIDTSYDDKREENRK